MKPKRTCIWQQERLDYEDDSYSTSCGQAYTLIDGTPKDNGMKYCCYCGKKLVEKEPKP